MAIDVKLETIISIKNAIKQAIINKGVYVSDGDSFMTYTTRIGQITTPTPNPLLMIEIPDPLVYKDSAYGYYFLPTDVTEDISLLFNLVYMPAGKGFVMEVEQGNITVDLIAEVGIDGGDNCIFAHSADNSYSFTLKIMEDEITADGGFAFFNVVGFNTQN